LTLTGDADDMAQVNLTDWTQSGSVVGENGHSYVVYTATHDTTAQLLIDQTMLTANHVC
jgi:hypothetical protein